jgi:L-fucose mutarotase
MEAMMLLSLDPVLTGKLLMALDEMGHGDAVVIADAHFTASKLARKHLIDLPGLGSPRVLTAVRSVVIPDSYQLPLALMEAPDGLLPVQQELIAAAQLTPDDTEFIERFAFYDLAAQAELIIRTGETRIFGNAIFRKGVTPVEQP